MNINKVILMGRLTADPELKKTQNDTSVLQFTVAINRKKDKNGDVKADFIDCVAFRQRAEFVTKYFRKGSSIVMFGRIETDIWSDQEGHTRKSTRVIADEVNFGGSKAPDSAKKDVIEGEKASGKTEDMFEPMEDMDEPELPF